MGYVAVLLIVKPAGSFPISKYPVVVLLGFGCPSI